MTADWGVVGVDQTTAVPAVELQNRETQTPLVKDSEEATEPRSFGAVAAVLAFALEVMQIRGVVVIQKAIAHPTGQLEITP